MESDCSRKKKDETEVKGNQTVFFFFNDSYIFLMDLQIFRDFASIVSFFTYITGKQIDHDGGSAV